MMSNNVIKVAKTNHTPEKIDHAIKQLEHEIFTLDSMIPVDYVVDICCKNNYRQAYVFYLKYRFLKIRKNGEDSQEWLDKAIEQSKMDNDNELYMNSLLDKGGLDYEKGQYLTAIKVWMQCLEYAVKLGNNDMAGHVVMSVGKVYFAINQFEIAKQYHEKAWDIAMKTQSKTLKAGCCINIAVACLELQQPEEALKYLVEGEKYIDGLTEYSTWYSELMINLGRTKSQLGLYDEAIKILQYLYNSNLSQDLKWQRLLCEVNLGKVHFQSKQLIESSTWFQVALKSAQEMNASHMEMTVYKWLYTVYVEQHDYKSALQYYTNYIKCYEVLFKIEDKHTVNLFDEDVRNIVFKSQLSLLNEEFGS